MALSFWCQNTWQTKKYFKVVEMEIDDKLKNRLAGTAVVTVLAVIFLPMLFDDPVEKKGQVVSELSIPHKPEVSPLLTTAIVPDKSTEVPVKSKPTPVNTGTETLTADELNSENPPLDSETADLEEESPAPVQKKSHKKTPVVTEQSDKSEEASKPLEQKEKKTAKAKVEKKPSKTELPVLDAKYRAQDDVKSAPDVPSLPVLDKRRWVVQVASLTDEAKATAFRDKLRTQGFPATVESAWIKGKGRVYRLKVGPELDAERAQAMKAKINQLNNVNSIAITE